MEARMRVAMHGLDARRVIDVRDCRNIGARHVELVDAEQRFLVGAHRPAPLGANARDEQHVRRVHVELEPVGEILAQDRRREWTERLAVLDLEVQELLHRRRARVAEDRAAAERARPEFHAALEPAHRLAGGERVDGFIEHRIARHDAKPRACGAQAPHDLVLR